MNSNEIGERRELPKWFAGVALRRKHRLALRATRKSIEKELGHKLTGRQWIRRRRALALEKK